MAVFMDDGVKTKQTLHSLNSPFSTLCSLFGDHASFVSTVFQVHGAGCLQRLREQLH